MRRTFLFIFLLPVFLCINAQKQTITVLNEVLFYDGYNTLEKLGDEVVPAPEGVIRQSTSVCTTKLSDEQLSLFGDLIEMEVIIKAACDNYDRLGHVHLALVPKGAENYDPAEVDRYEIGRFITPFMDKNKALNTVPYNFDISYLKHVFKDKFLLDTYDFWMELEVFGVPYVANSDITGCSGRSDVFYGSLLFQTSNTASIEEGNVLIPLFNKQKFNNYQEGATDQIGKTVKTINFTLDENLPNSKLVLITSNHGAKSGGEEYNRRWHYVYLDKKEILSYMPGRETCEPFRKYNTQPNFIYGQKERSDYEWQSFSNWCPGDVIDTRIMELGELKAGSHTFKIEVPDAKFKGYDDKGKIVDDGNFPLSLYFLSTIAPTNTSISVIEGNNLISVFPNPVQNIVTIETEIEPQKIVIFNSTGQKVYETSFTKSVDISSLAAGIYWMSFINGTKNHTQKIIKQ